MGVQALKFDIQIEMLCKQLDIWSWSSGERFRLEIRVSYHHLCEPFVRLPTQIPKLKQVLCAPVWDAERNYNLKTKKD